MYYWRPIMRRREALGGSGLLGYIGVNTVRESESECCQQNGRMRQATESGG